MVNYQVKRATPQTICGFFYRFLYLISGLIGGDKRIFKSL